MAGTAALAVRSWRRAWAVKSRPRTSQRRPSVAVWDFVDSSDLTRDCKVVEVWGEEGHGGGGDAEFALLGAGGCAFYADDVSAPEDFVDRSERFWVLCLSVYFF